MIVSPIRHPINANGTLGRTRIALEFGASPLSESFNARFTPVLIQYPQTNTPVKKFLTPLIFEDHREKASKAPKSKNRRAA